MARDPGADRAPLGMRLLWVLVPALLFALYFFLLLRESGDPGGAEPGPGAAEAPAAGGD